MSQRFVQIEIRVPDAAQADRLLAEAYAAGASGCEERASGSAGKWLLLYAEADRAEAVARALDSVALDSEIGPPEPVSECDWAEGWREGLAAVVVSPRLVVRPPFVEHPVVPGQANVVIDPGQAFGTGGHESTRLALELLDRWLPRIGREPAVLDVGTGTGVLAIAAAKLGAGRAVGFDLDPVAAAAASQAAVANGVSAAVDLFVGGISALGPGQFDLGVANLLRKEIEPILPEVLDRIVAGGVGLFAGLLEADRSVLAEACERRGWEIVDEADRTDARGDVWIGLVARAAPIGPTGRALGR